jgi:DNA-binding NarL/FixJ family response regulator
MQFLVVDDHPVVREGLAALLRQADPNALILEAGDGATALRHLYLHAELDAVLLDLRLPGLEGVEAIGLFGRARPDVPVIVVSSSENPDDVRDALAAGALGYVPKSASRTTLVEALRLVLRGEVYVPPLMLAPAARPGQVSPAADGIARLTERQVEVLRLLGGGTSNKEIGLALGLSEKTVKAHVGAIFRALAVVNRTQAALAARAAGLFDDGAA